jgi:DNA invertase Pin-like site-specific DNA recombinase
MKYTIAKYLRISSEDIDLDGQDKFESNSIANQRNYVNDYIAKIPEFINCTVIEELDDGRSGTNFDRPGVQRLIALAQAGKVQCIVVKDLSRWGRNYLEVGDFLEQKFPAWGVRFISINDCYDSATLNGGTGGIDIAFKNLIYELYSHDLSQKVRSAKISATLSGKSINGYAFYGYSKDPNNRHKLVIDEPAAIVVRRLYDLAEQGYTLLKLAKTLNAEGVVTPGERQEQKGEKNHWKRAQTTMWDSSRIGIILSDERYTGKLIFGKKKNPEVSKSKQVKVPESDWIVVDGAIPSIITQEQFQRVRAIINGRNRGKNNKNSTLLFAKKLKCGHCGRALCPERYKGIITYHCATKWLIDAPDCKWGSVRESELADVVLTALRHQIELAMNKETQRKQKAKTARITAESLRSDISSLRRFIEKANTAKMSLWERYNAGELTRENFQAESAKITAQVTEYETKAAELESNAENMERTSGNASPIEEQLLSHATIESLTPEILDKFVQRVNVHSPDRIEVVFKFADPLESAMGGNPLRHPI